MPVMTFRFTTECEMTLEGRSYEEIYLRFKDFMHGDQKTAQDAALKVFPPESDQLYFNVDKDGDVHEIPYFKGDFKKDIANHCEANELGMH